VCVCVWGGCKTHLHQQEPLGGGPIQEDVADDMGVGHLLDFQHPEDRRQILWHLDEYLDQIIVCYWAHVL